MKHKSRLLYQFQPFIILVLISFIFSVPYKTPSVTIAIIKCLPILWLLIILLLRSSERIKLETNRKVEERRILKISLVFSLIGDFTLVWQEDYFIPGALSFAVAQVLMVRAFGFKHINWHLGAALYTLSIVFNLAVLLPGVPDLATKVVIFFYTLLLVTMLWRTIDRACSQEVSPKTPGWYIWAPVMGSVFFVISDSAIGLFLSVSVPHIVSQSIIISTYYAAQALIIIGSL